MPPGSSATASYSFEPPVRGILQLGPLLTEMVDPFGLASTRVSARLFGHQALAGEHDVMMRDYRPGDALRRVRWKASDHHGELMVREDVNGDPAGKRPLRMGVEHGGAAARSLGGD